MVQVTPPRPIDITTVFPELAQLAARTVRLHPRPGEPTEWDSSVGGPILWPVEEPWPTCPLDHGPFLGTDFSTFSTPAQVRAERRPGAASFEIITRREIRDLLEDLEFPLLPVLQIHAPDVPWFEMPHGAELMQVLWCPFVHDEYDATPNGGSGPWVSVRFHLDIDPLTRFTPPEPGLVEYDWFLPAPCVLHPEPVTEYPELPALDPALAERVEDWTVEKFGNAEGDMGHYEQLFATAPGWKLGGHPQWSSGNPATPIVCQCGAPMRFLATIPSNEWDLGTESWAPLEDAQALGAQFSDRRPNQPTCISVGDGHRMRIFICPDDPDHPVRADMISRSAGRGGYGK
jgi:hypothetical protein